MGGQFDDNWLDDSLEPAEDEFTLTDPFEGIQKRDQNLFFQMLDIVPDDKREQAMDYFIEHPKKIREVIKVIKAKKAILEDNDTQALRALFSELKVDFEDSELYDDTLNAVNKDSDRDDDMSEDMAEDRPKQRDRFDEYEEDEY